MANEQENIKKHEINEIMPTLNDIFKQSGEPIYFSPFNVWVKTIQPDPKDAIANPPFNTEV